MPKKVLVALPPGLLEQIDFVASMEHRNRSDLIREALRRYLDAFKRSQTPKMVVSGANGLTLGSLIDGSIGGVTGERSSIVQSISTGQD